MEKFEKKDVPIPPTEEEKEMEQVKKAFDHVEDQLEDNNAEIVALRDELQELIVEAQQKQAAVDKAESGLEKELLRGELDDIKIQIVARESELKELGLRESDWKEEGEKLADHADEIGERARQKFN